MFPMPTEMLGDVSILTDFSKKNPGPQSEPGLGVFHVYCGVKFW